MKNCGFYWISLKAVVAIECARARSDKNESLVFDFIDYRQL